jgi:DNA-binding NtrC family response regulator
MLGDGQLIAVLEPDCGDLAMHEEKIAALGYEPVGFSAIGLLEEWLSTQVADLIMIDSRSIPTQCSARDLQNIARGAPVVLISHDGKEEILDAAFALQFTILREPLSSRALADAIRGHIVIDVKQGSLSARQRPARQVAIG